MRNFKFFHGLTNKIRATWEPELVNDIATYHNMDAEGELTTLLSEQIAREIDMGVLNELTRRINDENNNLDYFNHWMDIGNNRA